MFIVCDVFINIPLTGYCKPIDSFHFFFTNCPIVTIPVSLFPLNVPLPDRTISPSFRLAYTKYIELGFKEDVSYKPLVISNDILNIYQYSNSDIPFSYLIGMDG